MVPKGLGANLNVADISSVVPYWSTCKRGLSEKWEFFPLGWFSEDLQPWRDEKLEAFHIFSVLFEADMQNLKILPFGLKMRIGSQLWKTGKTWWSWRKKQACRSSQPLPEYLSPVPTDLGGCVVRSGLLGVNLQWLPPGRQRKAALVLALLPA